MKLGTLSSIRSPGRMSCRTLLGHTAPISSLSWSAEGLLLSGSWDETAKAWDLETATCQWTLGGHEVEILRRGFRVGCCFIHVDLGAF